MTRLLRFVLYREDLRFTPHAVVSVETHRITRRWRAWVRPVGYRAFLPAPAAELALLPFCESPDEVRALLVGAAP